MRWFMDLSYPLMKRARHRKAAEVARQAPTAADFDGLGKARQALVVTFKKSGEPVPTPVNCGLAKDGKLYFRSEPHVAKIKRINNNPCVLVGPCNICGKPRGPLAQGTARILSTEESRQAYKVLRAKWSPWMWPSEMAMDRLGVEVIYIEVIPQAAQ